MFAVFRGFLGFFHRFWGRSHVNRRFVSHLRRASTRRRFLKPPASSRTWARNCNPSLTALRRRTKSSEREKLKPCMLAIWRKRCCSGLRNLKNEGNKKSLCQMMDIVCLEFLQLQSKIPHAASRALRCLAHFVGIKPTSATCLLHCIPCQGANPASQVRSTDSRRSFRTLPRLNLGAC